MTTAASRGKLRGHHRGALARTAIAASARVGRQVVDAVF
jgi:hypothetical protein